VDRIATQAGGVVGIGIAAGDGEDPLAEQLAKSMDHLAWLPAIDEAGTQSIGQSQAVIGSLEQHGTPIRAGQILIELGHERLAKKGWKENTLCRILAGHSKTSVLGRKRCCY
jgi:hypothetical protein